MFQGDVTWFPEAGNPLRFTDFTVVVTADQPDADLYTSIALEDNTTDYYNVESGVQEEDLYMNMNAKKVLYVLIVCKILNHV